MDLEHKYTYMCIYIYTYRNVNSNRVLHETGVRFFHGSRTRGYDNLEGVCHGTLPFGNCQAAEHASRFSYLWLARNGVVDPHSNLYRFPVSFFTSSASFPAQR